MGSPLRLTLPGLSETDADAAWSIVDTTFTRAEEALTRFDASSPLCRLNRASGTALAVPPPLARALAAAWRAYRATNGRFDPRIVGALEEAGERAGVPLPLSPGRLGPAERWLWLDPRAGIARISAPIDLGGIGKGLALRWAAAALRRAGHHRFLVSAGGDLFASGLGPLDRPWIVGIEDPTGGHGPLGTIAVVDAAVATSSIAVRSWHDAGGRLRHHLIDPATLAPSEPIWAAVTVVDPDPVWADVRAKVAYLAGRRIASVVRGRLAWWVSPIGRLHTAA
jgi:thiamine biosynthesis lipoprotein